MRLARLGALALGVGALGGCPEHRDEAPRPDVGLKVPLPEGWVVLSADGETLRAGPAAGPWVVAVGRQPGGRLPTASQLEAVFRDEGVEVTSKESSENYLGYVYSFAAADGGTSTAMLGFRRVGSTVFRCASAVGAHGDWVEQALGVCRDIGHPAVSR